MQEAVTLTGVVLSSMAAGEYDRRLVLLTKERGRLTAFARGARRQGSTLLAACRPFVFGSFSLYEGRSAYTVQSMHITQYFTEFSTDVEAMAYGCYFAEIADYYSRENVDEREMLNLLYFSFKALLRPALPNTLVRMIFELRTLVIQGEYPQVSVCPHCHKTLTDGWFAPERDAVFCAECRPHTATYLSQSAVYALQYIIATPVEKLYTFTLTEETAAEVQKVVKSCMSKYVDRKFQSLAVLDVIAT